MRCSWKPLFFACLVLAAPAGRAAENVKVESSKPVASPDGRRSVVVDRLFPVVDGEAENFSGRMVVRVSDSASTTPPRQRFLEASQVRLLQPAQWMDDTWAAFVYNIAKSANGIVYMNAESGRALQLEVVAPPRRMGASNTVEQEITSFDVTDHGTSISRFHNIPFGGGTAFPLYLKQIPGLDGKPYPLDFLKQVDAAIQAYDAFANRLGVPFVEPEQASESFSPDAKKLALLICTGPRAALLLLNLDAANAEAALQKAIVVPLGESVQLSCRFQHRDGEEPAEEQQSAASRYTTAWQPDGSVAVEREIFSTEDDSSRREVEYVVSPDGKLKEMPKAAPPEPTPSPAATEETPVRAERTPGPEAKEPARQDNDTSDEAMTTAAESAESAEAEETAPKPRTRTLQVTTRSNSASAEAAPQPAPIAPTERSRFSLPAAALEEPETVVITPAPEPTKKPGLLRRIIPGRSRATQEAQTPPPPARTPSD